MTDHRIFNAKYKNHCMIFQYMLQHTAYGALCGFFYCFFFCLHHHSNLEIDFKYRKFPVYIWYLLVMSPSRAGSSWRIFSSARLVTFSVQLEKKISAQKSENRHLFHSDFFPLNFTLFSVFFMVNNTFSS